MSEQPDLTAKPDVAQYPALIGLRDTDNGKALELAMMLDDRVQHNPDSPHMIVLHYLRNNWPKIVAAAELEHKMNTSRATLDRIEELGGLQHAATLAQ